MRWQRHHIEIQESILTVLCQPQYTDLCYQSVVEVRKELERYISRYPDFKTSFHPLSYGCDAPPVVRRMCRAAENVGVGPMAAVAGAVAEIVLERLLDAGVEEAVVDNGGDIVLKIKAPITIGIYMGQAGTEDFGFLVEPQVSPLSVCTSSGTIGHSKSFGCADAAVVFSENACLADAAATALGNRIQNEADLESAVEMFSNIPAVTGVLAAINGKIALFGRLPRIVKVKIDDELITRGQ
ncbi:UPF0280 family protein [candidate division KSB1 bacterium]|nr:UPF0280 family protein [candidate division KSB1 bacterium]